MLTKSNIESKGFTFFRRIEGEDLYSMSYQNIDDRNEYISQTKIKGYQNLVSVIHYDDGRLVIKVLLDYLNLNWSDDWLFSGKVETNEEFNNIIKDVFKYELKPIKFK